MRYHVRRWCGEPGALRLGGHAGSRGGGGRHGRELVCSRQGQWEWWKQAAAANGSICRLACLRFGQAQRA